MSENRIQSNALLVALHLSAWTARKYDKRVSDAVATEHSATRDAGRYNKMLLPGDAPSYRALTAFISATRNRHYTETLAWSDDNWRLLPDANHEPYAAFVRESEAKLAELLAAFLADYPGLKESAKIRLNGMYQENDYPTVAGIRHKYALRADYMPIPDSGMLQNSLNGDRIAALDRAITSRVQDATRGAMSDAWQRLYDCVQHVHERLATPGAIFRDSLVGNVRELCDVLTRLNVTGDENLERMRAQVADQIAAYDPATLRDSEPLRAEVAGVADGMLRTMRTRYIRVTPQVETAQEAGAA